LIDSSIEKKIGLEEILVKILEGFSTSILKKYIKAYQKKPNT
jgi:hypothetical protein